MSFLGIFIYQSVMAKFELRRFDWRSLKSCRTTWYKHLKIAGKLKVPTLMHLTNACFARQGCRMVPPFINLIVVLPIRWMHLGGIEKENDEGPFPAFYPGWSFGVLILVSNLVAIWFEKCLLLLGHK